MARRRFFTFFFTLLLTLLLIATSDSEANSITRPDTEGDVGTFTSVVLDDSGNPVVSYFDETKGDLKLMHCNDPNCAGGGESITSPDTNGTVGLFTSLVLDSAGNPVIAYFDVTNGDLKVMHCNDPNCAGGGEHVNRPDTAGEVGHYTSLVLDGAGNPVVSYLSYSSRDLKVLHCNDPNCAGGDDSINSPDTEGFVGFHGSLALDGAGNPVVSYYDETKKDLKVLHCNDPNCAGGGESITSPDTVGDVGWYTSLVLDGTGNPVVSYYDVTNADLKVLHCNDPNCAGGDESITSPDSFGSTGYYTSLALDSAGNPVISHTDHSYSDLKVLHCNDPNCAGGDERTTSPDTSGQTGYHASMALDSGGNPVVSYHEISGKDLIILHCNNANCASVDGNINSPDRMYNVGRFNAMVLDSAGNPVIAYYDATFYDLKLLHCDDPFCAGGGESVTSPDTAGFVGSHTSLVLDSAGNPVVSYFDAGFGDLKVLHCNDANCAGGGDTISYVDVGGVVGFYTSMVLDGAGNPVVSYYDWTNGNLKVLHCNDPNCAGGGESITSPDTGGNVGEFTSLALDGAGNPVVSYYDVTNADLKVLHCNDPNCAGGDDPFTVPDSDGDVGQYTSLALDGAGNTVVTYYDVTNGDLKVLHCNDPACAGGDESISSPDSEGDVGSYVSLALDGGGIPVLSYYDATNGDLRVLHCDDPNCAGSDERVQSPDVLGDVGQYTSLRLDSDGNPVVSYYDIEYGDLKLLRCFTGSCGLNVAPAVDAGGDQTVDEGDMVDFSGSAVDENGDDLTIAWDFGDGSTAAGTLTPQHSYADDGAYTVTLTATDEGGLMASDTLSVVVGNVAPDVDAGPDARVQVGNPVQFAGSFSDPGAADTHEISWDLGDGGAASGSLAPSHIFTSSGVFTVTLSVTDDDGGVGMDTLLVTVTVGAPLTEFSFLPLFLR